MNRHYRNHRQRIQGEGSAEVAFLSSCCSVFLGFRDSFLSVFSLRVPSLRVPSFRVPQRPHPAFYQGSRQRRLGRKRSAEDFSSWVLAVENETWIEANDSA